MVDKSKRRQHIRSDVMGVSWNRCGSIEYFPCGSIITHNLAVSYFAKVVASSSSSSSSSSILIIRADVVARMFTLAPKVSIDKSLKGFTLCAIMMTWEPSLSSGLKVGSKFLEGFSLWPSGHSASAKWKTDIQFLTLWQLFYWVSTFQCH